MSKDRQTPCKHYECKGQCAKGRDANVKYCNHCDKYEPRAHIKHLNQKKLKLNKIKEKEFDV